MEDIIINLTQSKIFANDSKSDPDCRLKSFAIHFGVVLIFVLMISGVAGNSIVCFILMRMRKSLASTTLHYVISVASSDLLMCVLVMPFDIVYWLNFPRWPLSPVYCKLWSAFYFTFHASSSLGIVAISIDTYITVSAPLKIQRKSKLTSTFIIFLIWMWSLMVGILIFIFQKDPPTGIFMFELHSVAYGAYLVAHLIAPQVVAAFCYFKLFRISKTHARNIQSLNISTLSIDSTASKSSSTNTLTFRQKLELAKTFLFVSVGHFMLWNPFLAVQIIYVLKMDNNIDWCVLETADTIVSWLTYLQCCLNPFLYALRKNYFKVLLKKAVNSQ